MWLTRVMAGTMALSIWMNAIDRLRYARLPRYSVPAKLTTDGSTRSRNTPADGALPSGSTPAFDSSTPAQL